MADALTSPAIPGTTAPASFEGELPDITEALKTPEVGEEDKRGAKLLELCERAFEAWQWYFDECTQTAGMLGGAQFGYWSDIENKWITEPESEDRDVVRVVANVEKRIVDQATGMLTQDDPIFGYAPGSSETGDTAAAEAADIVGRWIWQFHNRGAALVRKARGAFAFGLVGERVGWDSSSGEPYIAGIEEQMPVVGEDGIPVQPEPKPIVKFKGQLYFTTLQRDQMAFDPVALNCDDGAFFVIRERMGRSRVDALYPGKRKSHGKKATDKEGGERRVARYSPVSGRTPTSPDEEDDGVEVLTMWVRQTPDLPFGKRFVLSDEGDILDERDNDTYPTIDELRAGEQWPNYHWPVVFYYGDERENCPVGRGRILDVHGLQKVLNGDLSKGVQHRAVIGNVKIILPPGLDAEWNDDIGQIFRPHRADQAAMIGYVNPPPMPSDSMLAMANTRELMEAIPGVNAATMGNAPSADPSGRAISGLQQRDYIGIDPIKRGIYRSSAREMELALRFFRRYADERRKIVIVGKNEQVAVKFLNKSALAAGTDVVAFNSSALPQDPEKRAMYLMNLTTMLSTLKDDNQRMFMLELLQLHDTQAWFQKQMPYRTRAVRMTRRLLLGESPKPMPWDNPIVFKATFEEFLCKEEVESQLEQEMAALEQQAQAQPLVPGMMPAPPMPDPASLLARVMPLWQQYAQAAQAVLTPSPQPASSGSDGTVPPKPESPSPAATPAAPSSPPPTTPGGPPGT